ncbi:unnamed protein product [Arctia plantaginis]|uniref:Uncharacterized protein n=1 Tax=Arctia plantaginis TaxID=874455 RepID=A0A8S1AQN4_ARCPL|nr:unnamed protein product [Arctia plantaginis]CAB3252425.1 unnamed protein product [Arctia plantaginis]
MRKAANVILEDNTPPISPSSSFSRFKVGRIIAARNKRDRKTENKALKIKVLEMRRIIKRYKMRIMPALHIGQRVGKRAAPATCPMCRTGVGALYLNVGRRACELAARCRQHQRALVANLRRTNHNIAHTVCPEQRSRVHVFFLRRINT